MEAVFGNREARFPQGRRPTLADEMMNKTLIIGIALAALRADAGMPEFPPNVVAKSCVAVVIVQGTNRGDVVQYDVVETIRGLTPTNPLPFGHSSPLSCLKLGDRAIVFLELRSTSNRQSTISGVELRVRKIAMIRDGKVHYLGPRPGEPSTGKQVHDFDLDEFVELVRQSDRQSGPRD
jgi:hypothetical protein